MGWQVYCLTYELQSPLHIGCHKVGNVQRTRYYVPARNLWAACTERLARSGFTYDSVPQGNYQKIGGWVGEHCVFTYFFPVNENGFLFPNYTSSVLCYGKLSETEFERRFVWAHATTALDPVSTAASVGSLHEVEFLRPYDNTGRRTRLQGWVCLDGCGQTALGGQRWPEWLRDLQIGGERRYGFGRLRLEGEPCAVSSLENYTVELQGSRPVIRIAIGKPLWAHAAVRGIKARGMMEPLVGRETKSSARFGQEVTKAQICWVPGSVCLSAQRFEIAANGIWEAVKD